MQIVLAKNLQQTIQWLLDLVITFVFAMRCEAFSYNVENSPLNIILFVLLLPQKNNQGKNDNGISVYQQDCQGAYY